MLGVLKNLLRVAGVMHADRRTEDEKCCQAARSSFRVEVIALFAEVRSRSHSHSSSTL